MKFVEEESFKRFRNRFDYYWQTANGIIQHANKRKSCNQGLDILMAPFENEFKEI
jgi:hypothetical protein